MKKKYFKQKIKIGFIVGESVRILHMCALNSLCSVRTCNFCALNSLCSVRINIKKLSQLEVPVRSVYIFRQNKSILIIF